MRYLAADPQRDPGGDGPPSPELGAPGPQAAVQSLQLLFEQSRDVLFRFRLTPGLVCEYVSPAVAGLSGYPPEDFYRDPDLSRRLIHPDDRHLVDDLGRVGQDLVLRWVHRDGHLVHVEPRAILVRDAEGRPLAIEGIIRDVSVRVRVEAALRENEARLRSVLSAMAEGVVIFDAGGRLVDCNAAAERMMASPREKLLGRRADENRHALHEDGTPCPAEEYPAVVTLRTGQPVRGAVVGVVQPDGSVRWFSMTSEPLRRAGEDRMSGALVSIADMTAERRAWVEVRRRESQLRLAMECAGHAFWELEVARATPAAGDGAAGGRAQGPGWMALVHPDDRERALADFEAHVEGGRTFYTSEYRLPALDGSWRWFLASGRAVARDEAGRATRLAGTITDITEAKRLQEQLRRADRLAGVGTLAAGVAHEVNNPLAYVSANLAVLEEGLAGLGEAVEAGPLAELRQALWDARDGAARVRGIVQGLRQFALPTRTEEHGPVDVRAEIDAAVGIARNEITHRAQLRVDVPERLPQVRAAPQELGQVLVNLLVNAAQAIPEGHAADQEVRISARAEGGRVVIEVRDTGSGIAAADLPRIFDPFFTTKPVGVGSGLGLSVCHGIVTALGGSITVESATGRGTTFRLSLPALPAEDPASRPLAADAPKSGKRGRVLVVDDEALVAKGLARLLSAHEVTVITSPLEVLRRAASGERWEVVLCDLMMPEMSGMEVEERLISEAPELVPRIIYLTGGAFTERSRAFLAAGRPHLEKPVDPADLRAKVAERVAATLERADRTS